MAHSCHGANCEYHWDEAAQEGVVRTLQEIGVGELLTVNYLGTKLSNLSTGHRRRLLYQRLGFVCRCRSCQQGAEGDEAHHVADVGEAEEREAFRLSLLTARAVELYCRYTDDPAIASKTKMAQESRIELIEVLEECEAELGRYSDVTQALWRVLLASSIRPDFGSANPQFVGGGAPIDGAKLHDEGDQSLADLLVAAVANGAIWLRLWGEAEKYVARCRGRDVEP